MTKDTFLNSTVLRQRAEDKLEKIADKFDAYSLKDIKSIIHEIQVHQIELEMQNEELMSSQQRLRESEIKYYEFYNNAPVGFMTLNEEGKIIEANLRCAELLGYDKRMIIAKEFQNFIDWNHKDDLYLFLNRLKDTNDKSETILKFIKRDNSEIYLNISAKFLQDNINQFRVTLTDVSYQVKLEKEVEYLKELYSKV